MVHTTKRVREGKIQVEGHQGTAGDTERLSLENVVYPIYGTCSLSLSLSLLAPLETTMSARTR